MRPVEIVAFMGSVSSRRDVRAMTIEALHRTDWGADVRIVLDQARQPDDKGRRSTDTAREALERAAQTDHGDLVLFLEDDLEFNRNLRHNLEHWRPIVDLRPGDHLCASLYDPDIGSLNPDEDGDTWRVVHPELPYGSQAVLLARPTLNWILDGWRRQPGLGDIKIFRLAAEKTPIHYHRPSLVQHRRVPSSWGGVAHHAENYDESFLADEHP